MGENGTSKQKRMKIGLLSDSHSYIDNAIYKHLSNVDEIWHAGDIGNLNVTDQLSEIAPLKAVYGNIDDVLIRATFPENQIFTREGLKIFITHIGGYPGKYSARIKKEIKEQSPDLFICGHSHILKVMRDHQNKLIHLNPGACGIHGFHKMRTMLKFSIEKSKIHTMHVVELGKRGKI